MSLYNAFTLLIEVQLFQKCTTSWWNAEVHILTKSTVPRCMLLVGVGFRAREYCQWLWYVSGRNALVMLAPRERQLGAGQRGLVLTRVGLVLAYK
jgi:hypothetical protein